MKKIWMAICTCAIIFLLAGCSTATIEHDKTVTNDPSPTGIINYSRMADTIVLSNGKAIALLDTKETIEEAIGSEGEDYPFVNMAKQYDGIIVEYVTKNNSQVAKSFYVKDTGIKTYGHLEVGSVDAIINPYPVYEYNNTNSGSRQIRHVVNDKGDTILPHISESSYESDWTTIDYEIENERIRTINIGFVDPDEVLQATN